LWRYAKKPGNDPLRPPDRGSDRLSDRPSPVDATELIEEEGVAKNMA
jgi:hypothetical protein